MFTLNKFSLIILTRCNLSCRLCCEYVPQNRPFPDMSVAEAEEILRAVFEVADRIGTLHLTGGGEPFLHPHLPELIDAAMAYQDRFDRLMLFTNSTIPLSEKMKDRLQEYRDKLLVQASRYGIFPEREERLLSDLIACGVPVKAEKYYGEDQSFGGWLDFGHWDCYGRSPEELDHIFHSCSVTSVLKGNWRTRDGKVHWCSRSQRGMELGLIPEMPEDYVDLMDRAATVEEKRQKFQQIAARRYLSACDHCSGDAGTEDQHKRYPAAEQMRKPHSGGEPHE